MHTSIVDAAVRRVPLLSAGAMGRGKVVLLLYSFAHMLI